MAHLQHDDFYLVLPSHARSEGLYDNRPQHFKVHFPKELILESDWEVGVTELLYTNTFYESPRFKLTTDDRTWSVTNGARLDGGTHFTTLAEEQYPTMYLKTCLKPWSGVLRVSLWWRRAVDPSSFDGCCNPGP